jgi:deoxyribodipyrimidine photo-lyase
MKNRPVLIWFRRDLRLADNPALFRACALGKPVVPVYIWAPDEEAPWQPGSASKWWLHHSLAALSRQLTARHSALIVRAGASLDALRALVDETGADTLYWNRLYEPTLLARDAAIERQLGADGLTLKSFNHTLLYEPGAVSNQAGHPFQVFTPFWKHCLALDEPREPLPAPSQLHLPDHLPGSLPLDQLGLLPRIRWDAGLNAAWKPGEAGAHKQLERFLAEAVAGYKVKRDYPGEPGTSRLSPHLHFGEIGPCQIWHAVQESMAGNAVKGAIGGAESFLREVGWREFAAHLLYHFPDTPEQPLRKEFSDFPWRQDAAGLKAWQRGRTGYPIVDAGMRELWRTGWMHNRVRMIVASFLVKDLLLPWQEGARWFWDTLVDADLASNTLGWQWAAGCGADAAPYFRIFNPSLQGLKFDEKGTYVRRWIPEITDAPERLLHHPPDPDLPIGKGYPGPIVDHKMARDRALAALSTIKKG